MNDLFRVRLACGILALGTIGMLSSVCAYTLDIPAGEMSFQYLWAGRGSMLFAICGIVSILIYSKVYVYLCRVIVLGLIFLGGIEAFWGISQLYGLRHSNHFLYAITGSFYNPGPYSGYLALVFPVCLYELLRLKTIMFQKWTDRVLYYFVIGIILLICCILPAGMSRSSWVAVLVSGLFVCGIHGSWYSSLKSMWSCQFSKVVFLIACVMIITVVGCLYMYNLKRWSADGRLFMWKISLLAVTNKPFFGNGAHSFVKIYGETQEEYFKHKKYSEIEEFVAGSPSHAFNEYLEIAVEYGILILVLILLGIGYCLCKGITKRTVGLSGGIVSLMIFAFFSYPMQYPVFMVTFLMLLNVCLIGSSRANFIIISLLIGGVGIYWENSNTYEYDKKWLKAQKMCRTYGDEIGKEEFAKLYSMLKKSNVFLFEYGRCLNRLGEYEKSTKILKEALIYNNDPMLMNIIGKNCQAQKKYVEAEKWFVRSTHRLPGRIYPYYLLACLYAQPDFYKPNQLKQMATIVLTKRPKVYSKAIEEMRENIRFILKDCKIYLSNL